MGQMNFKKGTFFWIGIIILFLIFLGQSENFIMAIFSTAITVGLLYGLFILLAKFFN